MLDINCSVTRNDITIVNIAPILHVPLNVTHVEETDTPMT